MTSRARLAAWGILMAGLALAPLAAEAGDAKSGKGLAERWCASCHLVSDDGQAVANDAAPSFKQIANRPATTEDGLKAYLAEPHKKAMKGIALPRLEIDDLAAYIMSLRAP
jgi:cytochrome c